MLFRFSLYGLLKNQRYFEPFMLLVMLELGFSYTQIGLLVALRELTSAVLEVPSGAIADVWGRRRSMVAAFIGYAVAYGTLWLADNLLSFAVGMALVGVGDAFRTGTHKAMIFAWLRAEGREAEKVKTYGYTRSWSQIGSALAIPVAAVTVYVSGSYAPVFGLSALMALANVVNLATYPAWLDADPSTAHSAAPPSRSLRTIGQHLWRSLRTLSSNRPLRRLLVEGAVFGGTYKVLKDYLQPVVASVAVAVVMVGDLGETQATALTVAGVYVCLFGLSALASRRAHHWVARFESAPRAAWWIWLATLLTYAALAPALAAGWSGAAVVGFIALAMLHNLFRPLLVSRIDQFGDPSGAATILSVESQATATAAIVLAPTIGWVIDHSSGSVASLWPAPVLGASVVAITVAWVVRPGGGRSCGDASTPPST